MTTEKSEIRGKMSFSEQVIGAMKVAKECLDVLSKIQLTDEVRVVKAIEVAHKLSAQLSVLSIRKRNIKSVDIAERLKEQVLDNKYVEYEAIDRYRLAMQLPDPEIVAKLYRQFDLVYDGAPERAIKKKTVELIIADEFRKKLSPQYGREVKKSKKN